MGGKTVPLVNWGPIKLNGSVAIFIFPIIFIINDVITEVFGRKRAQSLIKSSLFIIFLLILFALFATSLPPTPRFKDTESAYDTIFGISIRISAASLIAFVTSGFMDVLIFSKIREKYGKSKLWLRNNIAVIIGQFIDTTVFITLAFYALNNSFADNYNFLLSLILPYWFLKCIMSIIETPFVYLGVNWLKKGDE